MSMFRRLLLMAKLGESGANIIIDFASGILTINHDGKGNNITVNGSEVYIK